MLHHDPHQRMVEVQAMEATPVILDCEYAAFFRSPLLSAAVLGRTVFSEHDTIRKYNNKTFPQCKVELDCEACDQCRESLSLSFV